MGYGLKVTGNIIRDLRKERGLTQEQIAKEVGVSVKHWGLFERGGTGMSITNLTKISEYFGVTVDYLIYGERSSRSVAFVNKYGERLEKLSKSDYDEFSNIVEVLLKGLEK